MVRARVRGRNRDRVRARVGATPWLGFGVGIRGRVGDRGRVGVGGAPNPPSVSRRTSMRSRRARA